MLSTLRNTVTSRVWRPSAGSRNDAGPLGGSQYAASPEQPSSWNAEANLPGVVASTDLSVIALNTEELVAVWADLYGKIKYATWGAGSGWIVKTQLGDQSATGKPALISRGPYPLGRICAFRRHDSSARVVHGLVSSQLAASAGGQ